MTKIETRALLRWLVALTLAALAPLATAQGSDGVPLNLPAITLQAGMHNIRAQVATGFNVYTGLMYRREMPQHEGMLFVYDTPAMHCFYMKNTFLPLSIAFLGDDGTVVNIADMQPQSLDSHCAAKPVRYALEMNQGWFAKRGVGPGFRISGPGGKPFGAR